MVDEVYVGYQYNKIWGTFENEKSATDWASEFPDCRRIVVYKKVSDYYDDDDSHTKGNI